MARFLFRLLLLIGVGLAVLYALQRHAPAPPMPALLELPRHTLRIAVEGRPADLPLYSLHALFSGAEKVTLDIRTVEEPGERWRLLAAGEIDLVVATLDEFALAVPRFSPGLILFPVAVSVGADAIVASPKVGPGELRVAYVSGSPGEFLLSRLAAEGRQVVGIPAPDAKTARAWYESGQVEAQATSEPYLSTYLEKGDQALIRTSAEAPITQVWVVSRQAFRNERQPRVTRQDLEQAADAWFLLMARLREKPGLAMSAIARDNDLTLEQVENAFVGTEFLTLRQAQAMGPEVLLAQLDELATDWSLRAAFNASIPSSFESEVDLTLLGALEAPFEEPAPAPSTSPSPASSPELPTESSPLPVPQGSPSPAQPEASPDPFSPTPIAP